MEVIAEHSDEVTGNAPSSDKSPNYIRFSVRADVQQRTEPLEQAIHWIRDTYLHLTASKLRFMTMAFLTILFSISLRFLLSAPTQAPRPDIIKVAAYANSLEPMLKFSEAGISQLTELSEMSTAVWDLGESVRIANLTSTPIIVDELENLYKSLTDLTTQLTGFFAAIDGAAGSDIWFMHSVERPVVRSYQPWDYA